MKKKYFHPVIVDMDGKKYISEYDGEGLFPVVEGLTKGYAAGRAVKQVLGGISPVDMLNGLVNRKMFIECEVDI